MMLLELCLCKPAHQNGESALCGRGQTEHSGVPRGRVHGGLATV